MRIAIFGGSFDPVHTEHVLLARDAVRALRLDKLFVMPAHTPPHKQGKVLSSDEDRLQMCRLAFQNDPKIVVSDYEMSQGGTSYTYLTCRHFKEEYPKSKLFFLVGTDMLRNFPTWKNPQSILEDATIAVCSRGEEKKRLKEDAKAFKRAFGKAFKVIDYEGKKLSSTRLRVLAAAGESLSGLTPPDVEKYILERELYRVPFAKEALALEKPSRRQHSLRVAEVAAGRAYSLGISERAATVAALFHDCAKSVEEGSELLKDFVCESGVPAAVVHQFSGAYLAERFFGVTGGEVLNAIRYHTSGRAGMSELEKLIFLADMIEPDRDFAGVEELRSAFYTGKDLDECLRMALERTIAHLEKKGKPIYRLTKEAWEYYQKENK